MKDKKTLVAITLFVIWAAWRTILFFHHSDLDFDKFSFAWGATYQVIALWGAVCGFVISRSWGGTKSIFGKSLILFSVGLLLQSFGQAVSSYYVYKTGEIPYPGIGDIGFFGSVVAYIFAVYYLAKTAGMRAFAKTAGNKAIVICIPIVLAVISYSIFLKGYEYDWSNKLTVFLDFSYPIYQAVYVAIAFMTLIISWKYLGGIMKVPVLLFLFALIMQYLSDFVFLYQAMRGLYIPEGVNDCMYFFSYFLMALAVIRTGTALKKISNT